MTGELPPDLRELRRAIHRTIKKVTEDLEEKFHFNTAIAAIMELFNALSQAAQRGDESPAGVWVRKEGIEAIVLLLAPFVPHAASELWQQLHRGEDIEQAAWPAYSPEALEEEQLLIIVQVNGKLRGKITVPAETTQQGIEKLAREDARVGALLDGKKIGRVIYVPRRLVNIVLEG